MLLRSVRLGIGLLAAVRRLRVRAPARPTRGWAGAGVRHAKVSVEAGIYGLGEAEGSLVVTDFEAATRRGCRPRDTADMDATDCYKAEEGAADAAA
jgi:hypothetical protein